MSEELSVSFKVSPEWRLVGKDSLKVKNSMGLSSGSNVIWYQHPASNVIILSPKELDLPELGRTKIYANKYYLTSIPKNVRGLLKIEAGDTLNFSITPYEDTVVLLLKVEGEGFITCRTVSMPYNLQDLVRKIVGFLKLVDGDIIDLDFCVKNDIKYIVVRRKLSHLATLLRNKLKLSPPILEKFDLPEDLNYSLIATFDRFVRSVEKESLFYDVIENGLRNVSAIWIAIPSSYHHSCLFDFFAPISEQYYNLGYSEGGIVVIYVNPKDPAYMEKFVRILVHELVHVSLQGKLKGKKFIEETLAYLTQFKMGLYKGYDSIARAVKRVLDANIICHDHGMRARLQEVYLPIYVAYALKDKISDQKLKEFLEEPDIIIDFLEKMKHEFGMENVIGILAELGVVKGPKGILSDNCEEMREIFSEIDEEIDDEYIEGIMFWFEIGQHILQGAEQELNQILRNYPRLEKYFDLDMHSRIIYQFIKNPQGIKHLLKLLGRIPTEQ